MTNSPSARYSSGVASGAWVDDPAQRAVLPEFDRIAQELQSGGQSWWRYLLQSANNRYVRGLYLWGGVGRGKTFLMDLFYNTVVTEKKLRLHFHRFMGRVHGELKNLSGRADPITEVAATFADSARLLCLDEFHVSDIGDAMILGRLLAALMQNGVTLVTTSNTPPQQLYRDGLQRANFLPAIALIERNCQVVQLIAQQDYRLRALTQSQLYHCPLGESAEPALQACFDRIAPGDYRREREIEINGRMIPLRHRAGSAIWFEFNALCDGPRAVADYIEVAQSFHSVFISNVPQFDSRLEDQARRFIHLVDEFYDRNVSLILSAAVPIIELYRGEKLQADFLRTTSRLIEMQSAAYLSREHKS